MFPVLGGISGSTSATDGMKEVYDRMPYRTCFAQESSLSVVNYFEANTHDRDTENTEVAQRKAIIKRNDELRLKVSSFLLQGLVGLRCLCAPVEGTCCDLLVRVISSLRLSSFRPSSRPSWFRPSCLLSFHLF